MYNTPSPEQVKEFMAENNLTGADIAALTGVNDRTARRWVAPAGQKGAQPISWACWTLILLLTEKKSVTEAAGEISQWKAQKKGRGLFERGVAGRPRKEGEK